MSNSFKRIKTHITNSFKKVNSSFTKVKPKKPWSPDLTWAAMDASTQLKQVFNFFDANGDGKISPLELTTVLSNFHLHNPTVDPAIEAQAILTELDFNGDGFVDLHEFMAAMDDSRPVSATSMLEHDEEDDPLRDAFEVFDADKNGVISAKELQRVLARLGFSNFRIGKCRKMIKGVDKNGDGFVDFDEFKSMMTCGINQV